ncbi:MAG: ferrous iron transport protein B [Candidatus Heimdallarchaeota archaeon]|nr:ferrous iron transport protein B [Candidatus Heimdallarchaeota archaeon]
MTLDDKRVIEVALAGNPNTGKSTLFNALTGLRQKIGNWPGVTVEKKEGKKRCDGFNLIITDLPGTYSLSAYSLDEKIARSFIIEGKLDVVVQIIDASNLERNLYLTTMLRELGANVVIALNMMDLLEESSSSIDVNKLSKEMGVPVVPMIASSRIGIDDLENTIESIYQKEQKPIRITYSKEIEEVLANVQEILMSIPSIPSDFDSRWLAIQIIQNDPEILTFLKNWNVNKTIIEKLLSFGREDYEAEIIDTKYEFITNVTSKALKRGEEKLTRSDLVDKVVTHKWLGIPIFLIVMWGAFQFVFAISVPFMELIDMLFGWLAGLLVDNINIGWLGSLLGDGIVGGLGAVLIFVPPIFAMFFILSVLEDSGYLARAAFVMDKIMVKFGLHGHSFIPMLLGFGCNVPAIMSTRSLKNNKDRMITILINPFMSCGARMPVFILFAGLFFGAAAGTVIFALYILGIVVAIFTAILLRKTFFKGKSAPFIMELPPYHTPKLRSATVAMWDKGKMYLKKAGTIILIGVMFVWFLAAMPFGGVEYGGPDTWLAAVGTFFEPIFRPLGFDWRIVVALIVGFVAKELVVGALGTIVGGGGSEEGIKDAILADEGFYPLNSLSLMVFTLLYVPCAAVIGVMRKETGSWRWTIFAVVYSTVIAWLFALVVFQLGSLMNLGL